MFRRFLTIATACLAVAAFSHSRAQAQYYYHAYVASTSTTAKEQVSYMINDIQDGASRWIYLSYYNNTTGVYCHTNNPAGSQIATCSVLPGWMDYTGVMYCGKKLYAFEYTVCTDRSAACGWAVHFTLKDKRTGTVMIDRYDLLDASGSVVCNP